MRIQILFILFYGCFSKCAFAVDSNDKPYETDKEPEILGTLSACPFYSDKPVCCSKSQDNSMAKDFRSIDATFGSDGGGCDICASNMKRFWCEYTCSPNQRDFLTVTGYANMTDPLNSNKMIEVQTVTLAVEPSTACEVYSSCSRTSFATQVSAMSTPGGFFSFQGEQAVGEGGQYIKVIFQESNSLQLNNIWACDSKYSYTTQDDSGIHYWDEYGYELKEECGCNTCENSCEADQILYEPTGVLYGLETKYILFVWGWAILFAFGITIYRQNFKKNKEISDIKQQSSIIPF